MGVHVRYYDRKYSSLLLIFLKETMCKNLYMIQMLKGKFSSGIEGALVSTLNRDFNWKQLSEMILYIFRLMLSKFF